MRIFARTALIGCLGMTGWAATPDTTDEEVSWPHWRGTAFDGTAQARNVFPHRFGLEVTWKRELGTGYSGVVLAGGRAVTLFSDGIDDFVGALDAHTGEEAWRTPIAPTFAGREGAVDGPCSTPAIDNGTVYALGPRGHLLAIDLADGRVRWRRDLAQSLGAPTPHWGFTSSPVVVDGRVVVITGGADARIVTAFETRDGTEAWSAGKDETGVSYQSAALMTLDQVEQIVAASDTRLLGIAPDTGQVLWTRAHGGARFYARIVNPVLVGGDSLFLNHKPGESALLGTGSQEPTWTTTHINRAYATPLYHEGSIFGYAGGALSAVDARDGSLQWRSRTPGSGWPILVDGHLVVLTKAGTLHVAPAHADGYEELASVKMLDRLVWTPPSFAYGRLYGRDSFGGVAAVDIVRHSGSAATRRPAEPVAETQFARWARDLEAAVDRAARVDRFLKEHPRSPVVEGNRVHVFDVGEHEDVAVQADMLFVRQQRGMHRIDLEDGRRFFHTSFELEPDARANYQLVRDNAQPEADPRNPDTGRSLGLNGEVSRIFMPEAPGMPVSAMPAGGRIETFELETETVMVGRKSWGGKREVRVYLPPGYDDEEDRYSTFYVHYGPSLIELTDFEDRLGRQIVVFIQATSAYEYARSQRGVHARMVATQLVPEIDRRYRTIATPERRTIAGAGEGGYSAFEIGLRYPHTFGHVVSQSLQAIGKGDRQLIDSIEMFPAHPVRVYLEWGSHDPVDPRNGSDGPAFNRRLRQALEDNGYDVTARELHDGLDIGVLAFRLSEILNGWAP